MDEIKEGSLVRAVKGRGRSAVEGVVTATRYIGDTQWTLDNARQCGYEVTVLEEPPAPALPTEPGYYTADLGRITGLWQLSIDGDWYYVGNEWRPVAQEDTQEPDGKHPLTRLEPVPVTVQKVIDYLESERATGWLVDAVREHFGVVA